MVNKLVIIGAGGHGRVVGDVAKACGYKKMIYLDDANVDGVEVGGKVSEYLKYREDADFIVAIGNGKHRRRIQNELSKSQCNVITLVHPDAVIGSDVSIGEGTVVMAGAIINTGTKIGNGVIINTSSSVDHDCVIGSFAHVSVGAHLAGTVLVGENVIIGAGATVINDINICDDCIIGAGAVVIKDIDCYGKYIGVPARKV